MQTAYNFGPAVGVPGQPFDAGSMWGDSVSFKAGALILPGTICELLLTSGEYLAFPLKDATTAGAFLPLWAGVAKALPLGAEQAYVPYPVPPAASGSTFAGYPIGSAVSFFRRARVWVLWDGNTGIAMPPDGAVNVWHSSTGASPQGVITTLVPSATVGAEIDVLPSTFASFRTFNFSPGAATVTNVFGSVYSVAPITVDII